ncbi:hypothetical protein DL89DRAFT_309377 [Linderina pennispora]|uniref:G-protein coupled receptors family 1 profile domain-containing protein n=1 Tax=Linderina pennispora TaxID=61395 RepID=A0A1Y1WI95_9FUNG|nr:uncharacterized protein DL89DRAFT_309377 [Linderina pennispora]ORX73247.1 hypothetical protein DL89DRAFT_309377 [Linderina pennispora]
MYSQSTAPSLILGRYPQSLLDYVLGIFVASASVSFMVFVIGLFVIYKRPRIWKNVAFRILLVIQIVNCLRFIFRLSLSRANISNETGCRILLALNNGTVGFAMYLCMYIVVYLQLTIIHSLSPSKVWPRVLLMAICVLCSFGPQVVYLFISPSKVGLESFCRIPFYSTTGYFYVLISTVIVWSYAAGIVSLASMAVISIHIIRTLKSTRKYMTSDEYTYATRSLAYGRSTAVLLNRALRTVVWFPIAPIIALWFNSALIIARYYTQKPMHNLEYVNVSLLSLMPFFMAVAFFVNPLVLDFIRDYGKSWSMTRRDLSHHAQRRKPSELEVRSDFSTQATLGRSS